LSSGSDGTGRLWRTSNGQQLHQFGGASLRNLSTVALAPSGRQALCGDRMRSPFWDCRSGTQLWTSVGFKVITDGLTGISESQDAVVVATDYAVIVYDRAMGQDRKRIPAQIALAE
jgi:WD40 repeat protein